MPESDKALLHYKRACTHPYSYENQLERTSRSVPGTAEIVQLVERDTTISNKFAQKAIQYILTCNSKLYKETNLIYE